MKTAKTLLAGALLASIVNIAVAGPGTDFWYSRQKLRKQQAAAKDSPKAPACTATCACTEMKK